MWLPYIWAFAARAAYRRADRLAGDAFAQLVDASPMNGYAVHRLAIGLMRVERLVLDGEVQAGVTALHVVIADARARGETAGSPHAELRLASLQPTAEGLASLLATCERIDSPLSSRIGGVDGRACGRAGPMCSRQRPRKLPLLGRGKT